MKNLIVLFIALCVFTTWTTSSFAARGRVFRPRASVNVRVEKNVQRRDNVRVEKVVVRDNHGRNNNVRVEKVIVNDNHGHVQAVRVERVKVVDQYGNVKIVERVVNH